MANNSNDEEPFPLLSLPQEIVVEILSRLPVKSLIRSRCVCRYLQWLVSDPSFTQKHVEMLTNCKGFIVNNNDLSLYRIVTISQFHLRSCSIHSLYREPFAIAAELDYQLVGRDYYHLVGSCNGLICVHTGYRTVFLWNPSIRSRRRLPDPAFEIRSGVSVTYGFGYDRLTGDYKVVGFFCHDQRTLRVKMYSMRHDCWKNIQGFPLNIVIEKSRYGVHVNGVLNWGATCLTDNRGFGGVSRSSPFVIVSYDLSDNTYKEVPQLICEKDCFLLTLGALGGCLCMVCYCRRSYAEIWVMKNYGIKESWTKLASIPCLVEYAKPLWVSKNGEILLEFRSGLALYNSKDAVLRYPMIDGLSYCRDSNVHVESLVYPAITGVDRQQPRLMEN